MYRVADLTSEPKVCKFGMLPQKRPEREFDGVRPYLENSTVCHMSMPIFLSRLVVVQLFVV